MTAGQRPSPEFLALQAAVTGRYVLDREIGRGGMGAVFLARDVALERPVAIKLLLPHLATDPALRERFVREARTAAQLMHPNIVPIYAVEHLDDLVWFVMGYIAGETLSERVRRAGPVSPDEALAVLRDIAWALAYAHGRGVVHRDIKPDNILLDSESGRALVADFGIARVASRDTLTDDGAFVGTVEYMSREQASALPVDGRADVYSLGASTYFALVGESPVRAPSLPAALGRLMREESPNVATSRPDVPATLGDVLARCLARDADRRLGGAEQLVTELRALDRAAPRVRPEIKAFLSNLRGLQALAVAGVGTSLLAVVTWDLEFIQATTRDGFVVAGTGLLALTAILVVSGLLTLRPQGVSYRELMNGLSAEAHDATLTARALLRKAFSGNVRTLQRSFIWTGVFNVVACSVFATSAFRALGGHGSEITLGIALSACLLGIGVGVQAIWRGLRPPEDFDRYLRSREETPGFRALIWFAKQPVVRSWWQRGDTAATEASVTSSQPTATLLIQRIESLFAQLPADVRGRLSDLVPAAAGLERVCAALRTRIEHVDRAMAELPMNSPARHEFAATRERASARLADGVTALESLRTDLLRLGVGLRHADGLTLELQNARELSAAIDAELHGHAEVKKLVG